MAGFTRRGFLAAASVAALTALAPNISRGNSRGRQRDWRAVVLDRDRSLHLYRPQSKETVKVTYYRKGRGWDRRAYSQICNLLRDVEFKSVRRMSPKLIDLLYIIQAYLFSKGLPYVIYVTSGYRTPAHNAKLKGAATNSLHVQGLAADIYVPGLPVGQLSKLVKAIGVGGVGVYARKNFVHVDVGRIRTWVGDAGGAVDFDLGDYGELFAGEVLDFETPLHST